MKRRDFSFASAILSLAGVYGFPSTLFAEQVKARHTALLTDAIFHMHHISTDHPESPERLQYFNRALEKSGFSQKLLHSGLVDDASPWLQSVHKQKHIALIKHKEPLAHKVASAAVSAAMRAVDLVAAGHVKNAFCATRPPGHHALNSGREEGFCYYNQAAIAARYAQRKHGFRKILIVDWDYHHGNGTEAAFYRDPDVLFFSSHDQFAYPGTGDPGKQGEGAGLGLNINVHLPCGSGDDDITKVFQSRLVSAADKFKPDFVIISAGFDSRKDDLLGCFNVSDNGFRKLTSIVRSLALKHCDGRIVSILEGGYNLRGNAGAMIAHLDSLLSSNENPRS